MSGTKADEHFIQKAETTAISDHITSVEFRKIFTPTGERLEIEAQSLGRQIRLDAIELESISWQDSGTIKAFYDSANPDEIPDYEQRIESIQMEDDNSEDDNSEDVGDSLTVTNEFAEAHLQKIRTSTGERLEIRAPKLGYQIQLDPAALASLTLQDTDTFTRFLETPFGPGGH